MDGWAWKQTVDTWRRKKKQQMKSDGRGDDVISAHRGSKVRSVCSLRQSNLKREESLSDKKLTELMHPLTKWQIALNFTVGLEVQQVTSVTGRWISSVMKDDKWRISCYFGSKVLSDELEVINFHHFWRRWINKVKVLHLTGEKSFLITLTDASSRFNF